MTDICLMFEVHQPLRLNRNFHRDLLSKPPTSKKDLFELYFDNTLNKHIFDRAARKCYFPANRIILNEIERFKQKKRQFKVSYGISGVFIEQCKQWNPDLLESFKVLARTGCVEFLQGTYYHSLASLFGSDRSEFIEQVKMHQQLLRTLFGMEPKIFENTECLYNNLIAKAIADMGYDAIITEGVERILGWRSPNYVYKAKDSSIPILLRNYRLSDDIGFRFSSSWWSGWPLTAQKYASWLAATQGQVIILFIDYETLGEHHWPETGILEFLKWLPGEVLKWDHLFWRTPREVVSYHNPVGEIYVNEYNTVSWADLERDPSAWIGNPMQNACYGLLEGLEPFVKGLGDEFWLRFWRYFQMSDHLYYMSVKGGGPGDVHSYFNPSGNPIDAFVSFSTVVSDFEARILAELQKPELAAKWILRRLPADKAFTFFYEFARPTHFVTSNLLEFAEVLKKINVQSLQYHMERGDFERWLSQVLGDKKLAQRIASIAQENIFGEKLRKRILTIVKARLKQLETLAAKGKE
ncbi:MAG: glycoside hydrolase family 57 protein [Candidatus Bathyarchaeota archaeon]|nr:MAG: glycoside hydrolase family 57 protein [Candidatus Bathyarchaeota archaeon]